MEDKVIDIIMKIVIILVIVSIVAIIVSVYQMIYEKKCYTEIYIEYPCKGATHYARLHRNQDIGCEKTKRICEGE